MRIAHTEASLGWGGQEIRILSEAAGLVARGHEVVIFAPRESRIYREALARKLATKAIPIGRKNLRGLAAMRRALARERFDVVNVHSSTDAWLAALACRTLTLAPPLVRTRHISAAIPDNAPTRWLYQRAMRHIVTTGEQLRAELVNERGIAADRVTSVPTGIDAALFQPGDRRAARAALGLPADRTLIGIIATLRSWKGHRTLIEAFRRLPGDQCALVIVGDGPQRQTIAGLVESHALGARVTLAGDQQDVVPWLQAIDIFALPSYANEGVPQALVQAMLCEAACVTTAVGAIGEAAVAGETALVVEPEDPGELTRALAVLAADRNLRERLGRAARTHALERFGYAHMLDRMEAIFRTAAS